MPTLPNAKQELFCQNYVKGMSQAEAYEKAGYVPNRCNASRLMKTNENIPARIAELYDETIPDIKWDRNALNNVYSSILVEARKAKNLAIAAKVADSIARVNGLIVNRTEHGSAGEFDTLSDHELIELIAEPLGGAGAFAADDGDDTVDDDAEDA